MPWQLDGSFKRVTNNTTEEAENSLWQQDLSANIKIIATRHDFHDHDLAEGIAKCINIDGYNSMLSNLKMGNFKITGIANGAANSEAAAFGQIAGSLLFDEPLRKLTLKDRAGNNIADVTIPSGSGGGTNGTVTSISGDGTLDFSVNPIISTGSIKLKAIGIGQSYSGGIAGIVIDAYGRVTQVTQGAYANTNLTVTYFTNAVRINSSTGIDATINSANTFAAGVVSTGNQEFAGNKQFNGSVAIISGTVYMTDLPTIEPIVEGQLWHNGDGILRVRLPI
jgi:hypothetical protein